LWGPESYLNKGGKKLSLPKKEKRGEPHGFALFLGKGLKIKGKERNIFCKVQGDFNRK